jgi:serine protease Do
MKSFSRARFGAAVAVAFLCGLIFASGFDLTRFSWAQTRVGTATSQVPAPAVASLAQTQDAFEAIVDRVKPAVVSIHVAKYAQPVSNQRPQRGRGQPQNVPPGLEDFLRQFGGDGIQMPDPDNMPREGAGSGFIVSKDGYILTNNHVVAGMDKVSVTTADKHIYDAKVIGRDPTTDIAVIKIEGHDFPVLPMGDDKASRVGQWVLAIGNPLDLDFTVTAGIISAKNRKVDNLPGRSQYSITDFIQTDAAINPGNSGGPLVNIRGEVIGINSAIASGTGYYAGYGFAIPIGLARTVMDDILEHGSVRRAVVGISLEEVTPEDAEAAGLKTIGGAKVADYSDADSPAKKAGIQPGDIITAVDGQPVDQVNTLQRIIRGYRVGQTVKLDVQRFGDHKQFSVKLGEVKDQPKTAVANDDNDEGGNAPVAPTATKKYDKLGLTLSAVPASRIRQANLPAEAKTGLYVMDVDPRSDAANQKAAKGLDIITEVLYPVKKDIKSFSDLDQVVSGLKSGSVITLRVTRLFSDQPGTTTYSIRIP